MSNLHELLQRGQKQEVWTKYCGFLDLNVDEFMEIQNRLLIEQIDLLHQSGLGRKLLGKIAPRDTVEFRQNVPMTTYEDYVDALDEKKTDDLPAGSYVWARTSGKTGQYAAKWAPYSERMYKRLGDVAVGAMLISSCARKGDVRIEPGEVMLLAAAPPPYISGILAQAIDDLGLVKFVPSIEKGEKMEFSERINEGFNLAMASGLDFFYGLASVLAKIGERFESGSSSSGFSTRMLNPNILFRLARGMIIASLAKRRMLPKDIWKVKGVITGGSDNSVYRDKIEHYWGRRPLEAYACTEGSIMAFQNWDIKGMTFYPDCDFLEFIPFEEHLRNKQDPGYTPQTRLLNDLDKGIYEIVFTNLMGGVFTRYRVGDLFEVTALQDEEAGINLPQFRFYSRCDDLIDLGGFARLNERAIWSAIEVCGHPYEDWFARKEVVNGEIMLHLYIEFKDPDKLQINDITSLVNQELKSIVPDVEDMENMLERSRLKITPLPPGTWARYMEEQRRAGAELAHIKPPHIQPSDEVVRRIMTTGKS